MQQVPTTAPLANITNQHNEQTGLDSNAPAASKRVVEIVTEEDPKYQIKTPSVGNENVPNEAAAAKKENE